MNRIFEPRGYFRVPDGTEVSAFLNSTDVTQEDVPRGVLGEMSIAAGRIGPGVTSWIHAHPALTQVTYVVAGALTVWMTDTAKERPHQIALVGGQAVIIEPGIFFQLDNQSSAPADVLYVTSPSYIFEVAGDKIIYDDATLVAQSWVEMEADAFVIPSLDPVSARSRREAALERIANRKNR